MTLPMHLVLHVCKIIPVFLTDILPSELTSSGSVKTSKSKNRQNSQYQKAVDTSDSSAELFTKVGSKKDKAQVVSPPKSFDRLSKDRDGPPTAKVICCSKMSYFVFSC